MKKIISSVDVTHTQLFRDKFKNVPIYTKLKFLFRLRKRVLTGHSGKIKTTLKIMYPKINTNGNLLDVVNHKILSIIPLLGNRLRVK